jgi:hypothetical protein
MKLKKFTDFYICEEDNIFDELSALYEDLPCAMYPDAPGLDLEITYDGLIDEIDPIETVYEEDYDGYSANPVDFKLGDIVAAKVFQSGEKANLSHHIRPFLIIYANAFKAYGFQLGSSYPATLLDYRVEVPEPKACGLDRKCGVFVNMVRGVERQYITKYIGHITKDLKQAILDKLYEVQNNVNGKYNECSLRDTDERLTYTIKNVNDLCCKF